MTRPLRPLREVASINPRFDANDMKGETTISFVPMAAISETLGAVTREEERPLADVIKGFTPFLNGDILIAKITPCFENGKIALARLSRQVGFGSTEFHVIRPHPHLLDVRYAYHFLRQPIIRQEGEGRMTGSAGQRRVPKHYFEFLKIPIPPLAEQKRLAAILDEADALRRKCREAIAKFDTLLHSIFIKMFGNRAAFSATECCIGAVVASTPNSIRTGPFGSQLLHSEFVEKGIAVLGIDNAVKNEFAWSERRYITPQKYEQLKRYTVHPEDVIITIMGTCGRCAVVPEDIPLAINTKHLCCITLDKSKCLPEFLHSAFLMHPTIKRQLEDASRGAIMDGLNMGVIKNLRFSFPPLDVQQEYVDIKSGVKHQKNIALDAARKVDDLFDTLQHQAFSLNAADAKFNAQHRTFETSSCLTLDF